MAIHLLNLQDDEPLLGRSKLLDAVQKTIAYATEHDGIGLTKSQAFNRKFATWAAENFSWPEYSAERLLQIQKTLDEGDVIPVYVMHFLLMHMKLGRHVKGKWKFNKKAIELSKNPARMQFELTVEFLFEFDHCNLQRAPFVAPGNWDIWLNIINIEAHTGVSEGELLRIFYGLELEQAGSREYWNHASFLTWHVLKPLCWLGYLEETEEDQSRPFMDRTQFFKTPLWRKVFQLDTDKELKPVVVQ